MNRKRFVFEVTRDMFTLFETSIILPFNMKYNRYYLNYLSEMTQIRLVYSYSFKIADGVGIFKFDIGISSVWIVAQLRAKRVDQW